MQFRLLAVICSLTFLLGLSACPFSTTTPLPDDDDVATDDDDATDDQVDLGHRVGGTVVN